MCEIRVRNGHGPRVPARTVTFHNSGGTVDVIADILGYFS